MARKIKGITVEIGGDTTKLDKALSDTNKSLGETQRSLRDVERLLKLDPKNTVLLEQKQRLLADAVSDTSKKLETLKTAAEQSGDELRKTAEGTKQYDALQREIAETEQKLKDLEGQAAETGEDIKDFTGNIDDLANKSNNASTFLYGISGAMTALSTAALASVPATEDYRDSMSKLETMADYAGIAVGDAKDALQRFYEVSGDESASFEAVNNLSNLKLEGEGLAGAVDLLSGAVIRFPDTLKIESLADSLQETVATGTATGQFAELLERLGISTEDFSKSLSLYSDESTRLDIALSAMAAAGLADVTEAWRAENEELIANRDAKLELKDSVAELADAAMPLLTDLTEIVKKLLDWFNGLDDRMQRVFILLGGAGAVIKPATDLFGGLAKILEPLGATAGGLAGAFFGIVTAVAMLVDIIPEMIDKWKEMSTLEKIISVAGAAAIAISAVVIAVSALAGNVLGAVLAATALIGSFIAVKATLSKIEVPKVDYSTANVPALADGAVLPPNKPFLAMVGDQRNGTNIEAPMSTIKQGVREVMNERGGGGSVTRVEFTGSLAQLGRVLRPVVTTEAERAGSSMRK